VHVCIVRVCVCVCVCACVVCVKEAVSLGGWYTWGGRWHLFQSTPHSHTIALARPLSFLLTHLSSFCFHRLHPLGRQRISDLSFIVHSYLGCVYTPCVFHLSFWSFSASYHSALPINFYKTIHISKLTKTYQHYYSLIDG
jgi:hypothetical protein